LWLTRKKEGGSTIDHQREGGTRKIEGGPPLWWWWRRCEMKRDGAEGKDEALVVVVVKECGGCGLWL